MQYRVGNIIIIDAPAVTVLGMSASAGASPPDPSTTWIRFSRARWSEGVVVCGTGLVLVCIHSSINTMFLQYQ